jgi:hypothetical protein
MLRKKILAHTFIALVFLLLSSFAQAVSRQVTLAWDASPDPSVSGYIVHYGRNSGVYEAALDVGANTFATITGLTPGTDFYFIVTAYSSAHWESPPSNELPYRTPPLVYPSTSIVSPAPGSQLNGPVTLSVNAQAIDPDSVLSRVEFFKGAEKIGESAAPPFRVVSEKLDPGVYTVSAVAVAQDGTRSPSAPVTVEIVQLRAASSGFRADGNFELMISGAAGSTNRVWYSDDLITWQLLSDVTNTTGQVSIVDSTAKNVSQRFYKVSSP